VFRQRPSSSDDAAVEAAADALVAIGGLSAAHWRVMSDLGDQLARTPLRTAGAARPVAVEPAGRDTPAVLMLAMMAGFGSAGDVITRDLEAAVSRRSRITVSDPAKDSFADGRLRSERGVEQDVERNGQSMRVRTSSTAAAEVCPDVDGRVVVDVDASVRLDLGGAGAGAVVGFAEITTRSHIVGRLADDGTVVETRFESHQQVAMGDGSNDGSLFGGSFVESTTVAVVPGATSDTHLDPSHYIDLDVLRRSSQVSPDVAAAFALTQAYAADGIAAKAMRSVEAYWRSGACVEVRLRPADGPRALTPGGDTDIAVEATAVRDGLPTGGVARAAMRSGGRSVTPSTPVPMPATVVYSAPSVNLRGGVVAVEVGSRRGIGRADLSLTTGGAWRFDTTWAGFRVTGIVCTGSPDPWELTVAGSPGGGVSLTGRLLVTFPPDDDTYGTFTFEGSSSAGGMSFANTSSGTVQFRVDIGDGGDGGDGGGGDGATLTIEPVVGTVTNGEIGRSGFDGEAELRAEPVVATCA
jgi:hypothetical protein